MSARSCNKSSYRSEWEALREEEEKDKKKSGFCFVSFYKIKKKERKKEREDTYT